MFPISTDGLWTPNLNIIGQIDQNLINEGSYIKWKVKQLHKKYLAKINLSCPMDFDQFPFDSQTCQFQMRIPGTRIDTLIIVDQSKNEKIASSISDYNAYIVPLNEYEWITKNNHSISIVGFNITLERRIRIHLVSVYLPSTLFVFISWIR